MKITWDGKEAVATRGDVVVARGPDFAKVFNAAVGAYETVDIESESDIIIPLTESLHTAEGMVVRGKPRKKP